MWRGRAHEIRSRHNRVAAKRFNTFDIVAGALFRLVAAPQHTAEVDLLERSYRASLSRTLNVAPLSLHASLSCGHVS